MSLIATNIRKHFGASEILKGVDITIEPGTITTVIGPSGSGKSTLLRALALLDPPTSGEITIDGQHLHFPASVPISEPWPNLTVVFQQLFLWPHLTIRQNALLPLTLRSAVNAEGRVAEVIDQLGIGGFADRFPNEVSIGQRQLGAIARAFALEPRYLLLDEITSALDVEYVAMILESLKRLRDQGVALLLISHLLEFARNSADQIVFLDGGCVVERGAPTILSRPHTARLERFLGLVMHAR